MAAFATGLRVHVCLEPFERVIGLCVTGKMSLSFLPTAVAKVTVTIDPAADGALFAAAFTSHECAYCLSPIPSGQRWVREKIYEPCSHNVPRYLRYHADLFGDEELSCWEKHQMELEITRTARTAIPIV